MTDRSVVSVRIAAALVGAFAFAGPALADELGAVRLFDQDYLAFRFDYNAEVAFPDMKTAGRTCHLWGVSGATVDPATGTLLVSSNTQHFAPPYSYKNYVIEVGLDDTPEGYPRGLSYRRTLVAGDVSTMGYDLDPRGVTINTSESGLGADGNIVVGCANNWLRAFDRNTGEPIIWVPSPDNGFTISRPNTSTEDVAFIPARNSFYTLWRSPASACTIFSRAGRTGPAFFVGHGRSSAGFPSAIAYLDAWPSYPRAFGYQPTILIATDDSGPGLEAYSPDSHFLMSERLSSRLGPGVTVLPLHGSSSELWIAAVAAEPSSGRLLLFNRGSVTGTTDVFVLCPIIPPCPGDFNLDGFVDFFDYDEYTYSYELGDPRADFNHDGFLDFFDWDGFQTIFETGC